MKFRLAGFRDEVRELVMRPGDQQTLSVALNALPGTLNLVSVPDGASFYVNDKAYGRGPVAIPSLPAGEYTVRAEKDGYGTVTRTVVISSGESAREEFRLSNVMGRLEVRSLPPGAQIFLDGRMVGKTTSSGQGEKFSDAFVVDNILEGEHLLVLKKDGYAQAVRHPNIKNSKTSQQNVRLRRVFVPDIEIETVRGSYRGMLVTATPEYIEIEVSLGIVQRFMKSEIRKMNPLGGRK